jgi:hypothetical protein
MKYIRTRDFIKAKIRDVILPKQAIQVSEDGEKST